MSISLASLKTWTSPAHFQEGEAWFHAGRVEHFVRDGNRFEGRLSIRDRAQICRFRVDDKNQPHSECPCRVNREEGLICGHIIAIMLAWRAENADPLAERLERVEKLLQIPAERRRHFRRLSANGIPASLRLALRRTWPEELLKNELHLIPTFDVEGKIRRPDQLPPTIVLKFSAADEKRLALLEDLNNGELPAVFPIQAAELCQIFTASVPGEIQVLEWPAPIVLHSKALAPLLTVDLDPKNGEVILHLRFDLPKPAPAGCSPLLLLAPKAGWVISGSNAWPLEAVPPTELQGLCSGSIRIPRDRVMPFLKEELPKLEGRMLVDNRVDLAAFRTAEVPPAIRLTLKGGLEYATGVLHAVYGCVEIIAGGPDPGRVLAIPDPNDPLAYGGRNPAAEEEALARLREFGFAASTGDRLGTIEGLSSICNLLSRCRFNLEPELGWKIDLRGELEAAVGRAGILIADVVIEEEDTPEWFRMTLNLRETGGKMVSVGALRKALERGEEFLQDGERVILLPREHAAALVDIAQDAKQDFDGFWRVPRRSCGFVQHRLKALAEIPVNAAKGWIEEAAKQNLEVTLDPVELPSSLQGVLRPYQEEGVRWLRMLERGNFGGILGDDMGLGKTLQTLVWLALPRVRPEDQGKPALVICPSSLVENWAEEAGKFLPGFKVLPILGSKRKELWDQAPKMDLVVVSYALLRRDFESAEAIAWSAIVLDEAQHIKNPNTQNALSAKKLQAGSRFVLTGTPMENQVRDLWSIMDFLMPGYLDTAAKFQKRFGGVIANGGPGATTALHQLRRKLKPFLLRRMKEDVAKDLPPRLEKRVYCDLLPEQRKLYDETEQRLRAEVKTLQAAGSSPLAVLQGIMRLRQICNHPSLLPDNADTNMESGKLEMFLELLDEIIDGGHRALVFSQFTSMLAILRKELEAREINHLYLDGSTQNRLSLVHQFNDSPDIPVFLISLMAGGTGLNLTGADVVIHVDPWWNPAVEDQATDRAHRIGQTRSVYAMKLICRDTIEARVARLQDKKRELIEGALGGDDAVITRLGWDEVRALLES